MWITVAIVAIGLAALVALEGVAAWVLDDARPHRRGRIERIAFDGAP